MSNIALPSYGFCVSKSEQWSVTESDGQFVISVICSPLSIPPLRQLRVHLLLPLVTTTITDTHFIWFLKGNCYVSLHMIYYFSVQGQVQLEVNGDLTFRIDRSNIIMISRELW